MSTFVWPEDPSKIHISLSLSIEDNTEQKQQNTMKNNDCAKTISKRVVTRLDSVLRFCSLSFSCHLLVHERFYSNLFLIVH